MADNPELFEILTIALGSETFGIPASIVLEILDIGPLTPVPNAPAFISKLINFRGRVVPLADLRLRCGIPVTEPTVDNRTWFSNSTSRRAHSCRDSGRQVHAVTHLDAVALIKPRFGTGANSCIASDNQFVMILDVGRIFASAEPRGTREFKGWEATCTIN
jgi:purine-binding chemotaxis protein CheW